MSRATSHRGFTLLEVMISLAILALALTAVAGINANSFESSNYARFVTVGTLLARGKMIDVEEELRKDGFGSDDKELSGDFSEEGYPKVRWSATIRKVEVDVGQLVGGLLGGDVNPDTLSEKVQGMLGGLAGADLAGASAAAAGGAPGGAGGAGGGMSGLSAMLGSGGLENMYKQVGETLAQSIREITLEITWGTKGSEESLTFVQYVTTSGRLAMPRGAEQGLPGDRNADTLQGTGPGGQGSQGLPGGQGGRPGSPQFTPGRLPNTVDK